MNERANDTLRALEATSRNFTRPGHPEKGLALGPAAQRKLEEKNCRHFFMQMGDQLAKGYPAVKSWSGDFANLNANGIVKKLDKLSAEQGGHWSKVTAVSKEELYRTLQEMANSGAVVIGGFKSSDPSGHGHLGFVSPAPPGVDLTKFSGGGPFVRDGNEHVHANAPAGEQEQRKYFPSTYGAVKASKAFPLDRTSWYIWNPKLP